MSPPQELSFGDWNSDTATSTNVDIQGDTFTLEQTLPDTAVIHFNAQNLSGYSDGDTVTTWPDDANGNDATGEGTYRASAINGNPAVEHDGSNDGFTGSLSTSYSQPNVLYVVMLADQKHDGRLMHGDPNANNLDFSTGNDAWLYFSGNVQTGSSTISRQLLTVRFDGANSLIREDGTQTNSGDAGAQSWGSDFAFGRAVGGGTNWDGLIGFVEMHDGVPASGVEGREQEIADAWGITL
jgi:hypothetical protein